MGTGSYVVRKCIWNLPTRGNALGILQAGSKELQVPRQPGEGTDPAPLPPPHPTPRSPVMLPRL